MKIIIFDVGDAFCSIVVSPKGYGMMIDCGSNNDKACPVDLVEHYRGWLGLKDFVTSSGDKYPLGLLHITHPDDDHVRNALRIEKYLKPYSVIRTRCNEFPDAEKIHCDYRRRIDEQYTESVTQTIDLGFEKNWIFQIPMNTLNSNKSLSQKIRNNSSIIRYIEHDGVRILYTGDLETPAWEWLVEHDSLFVETIRNGIDIFVAPHHGHNSGFPKCLFDIMGNAKVIIHSKGSEADIDGTNVSNKYSENADGIPYGNINDSCVYHGKVLTTRSNGHIFIDTENSSFTVLAQKASANHRKH